MCKLWKIITEILRSEDAVWAYVVERERGRKYKKHKRYHVCQIIYLCTRNKNHLVRLVPDLTNICHQDAEKYYCTVIYIYIYRSREFTCLQTHHLDPFLVEHDMVVLFFMIFTSILMYIKTIYSNYHACNSSSDHHSEYKSAILSITLTWVARHFM